jgi:outer membrane autotransporter protein
LPLVARELEQHKEYDGSGNVVGHSQVYRDATRQLAGSVRLNSLRLGMFSPAQNVMNRLNMGRSLYSSAPIIHHDIYGRLNHRKVDESVLRAQANFCYTPVVMNEHRFWFEGIHVQENIRSDDHSDGYGVSRTGFLLGMDSLRTRSSRVGVILGYFSPYLWQGNDRIEVDDYHAGFYFQQHHRGIEFCGFLGYAHQEYTGSRHVDLSALDAAYVHERYRGKTRGDSFFVSLEASKPYRYSYNYVLRPLIGLDYTLTRQKGFSETGSGAGLFALRYSKADYDQLFLRLGLNLRKELHLYTAMLRAQYINQVGGKPYPSANAQFLSVTNSPAMSLRGVDMKRDYLNLGVGSQMYLNSARSKLLSFDYDANLARRMTSHGLALTWIGHY